MPARSPVSYGPMLMYIGQKTLDDPEARSQEDDSDWEEPNPAGPSLSEADDQFIDLLVGDSDSDADQESEASVSADSVGAPGTPPRRGNGVEFLGIGELASDHIAQATLFLGRSVRRMSGTVTHYPSAVLVQTRARATSLIGETMQQTKALSNTLLDMTVNRAMRLSSDAITIANEATHAAISSASQAMSPPRVEHENGRVKNLPEALAERIACNPPELYRLVLRANEVRPQQYTSFACSLTGEACRCFSVNSTLRDLYLYGWNVDDEGAAQLAHCTSLRRLRLAENAVTDLGATSLAQISFLRELDLSKGDWPLNPAAVVTHAGAVQLATLQCLTILQLGGHRVGDRGAEAIASNLTLLRVLGLAQNGITDAGASSLVKLSTLTYLDLSRNTVGVDGARALSRHPSLLLLNMAHNPVNDEALGILLASPRIAFLSAASCKASVEALANLPRATALVALDLSNSNAMLAPALTTLASHPGLAFCEMRQAHPDTTLDTAYWQALHRLEDHVTANLQTLLARRRKILLLFISLARQRSRIRLTGLSTPQVLPLDLLMVILGFATASDYGKTPLQLQSMCRWIFRNMTEVEKRLRERRSLHVIERTYYNGVPESFRFAEESSGSCTVS